MGKKDNFTNFRTFLRLYGGDAKDAYAHAPPSETPSYLSIEDQYADWYKHKYEKDIDC